MAPKFEDAKGARSPYETGHPDRLPRLAHKRQGSKGHCPTWDRGELIGRMRPSIRKISPFLPAIAGKMQS